MMAFCGHDLSCASFNSDEVLQRAKANVDKFYPVVGVLENLNQSLAVMEHKLPQIFRGASKVHQTIFLKKSGLRSVSKLKLKTGLPTPILQDIKRWGRGIWVLGAYCDVKMA